jgi:hypothetical protein
MFSSTRTCTRMHLVAGYEWLRPKVKLEGLYLWILRAPFPRQCSNRLVDSPSRHSSLVYHPLRDLPSPFPINVSNLLE